MALYVVPTRTHTEESFIKTFVTTEFISWTGQMVLLITKLLCNKRLKGQRVIVEAELITSAKLFLSGPRLQLNYS